MDLATVPGTLSGRYLWRGPEAMCLMRGGAGEGGRGVGERGEGCETDIRAARGAGFAPDSQKGCGVQTKSEG